MKRGISVLGVAVVSSLVLAGSAMAHARSHPSDVTFDGFDNVNNSPTEVFFVGHVKSPVAKCVPNRTIKVFFQYGIGTSFQFIDIAKSGQSGAFAAEGPGFDGDLVEAVKLKLIERKVGPRRHRHICEGRTRTFD